MSQPVRPSVYAGLRGLFDADPVELAGRAFPLVFGGSSLRSPLQDGPLLDQVVAGLGGIPFGTGFLGFVGHDEWARIQPLTMEIICLWQQALVAAQRSTGGDHARNHLVLLRRGAALLQVPDPVGFLRAALEGGPEVSPLR